MILQIKINYAGGIFTGLAWSTLSEYDMNRNVYGANPPHDYG